eukprot:scaffold138348_cov53-Prasinocladus_malaysianus.AAC.1
MLCKEATYECVLDFVYDLFDVYIDKGLEYLRAECTEPLPTVDINAATNVARYVQGLLARLIKQKPPAEAASQYTQLYIFDVTAELTEGLQVAARQRPMPWH